MTARLSRRQMLLAAGAGAAIGWRGRAFAAAPALGMPGLGAIAATRGILYGSLVRGTSLQGDPAYAALVARDCRLVVCALEMHWAVVAPRPDMTDFSRADAVAAWARAHEMKFRGHALLWHQQVPAWFAALPADRASAALTDHIRRMCSHFAGRVQSWDVVNEALLPNSGQPGHLRKTVLLDKIGPGYLDLAFRTARETDPKALLVYNEFGIELDLPDHAIKRRALLELVDGFRKRGTPIDAIGIQSHIVLADMPHFNESVYAEFLSAIRGRGLRILLTELDVTDTSAPSDIRERDAQVAAAYRRYLAAALRDPAVIAVINWGMSDRDSWISRGDLPAFRRADGSTPRPLLFDAAYQPKPAYAAMADVLRAAPPRAGA